MEVGVVVRGAIYLGTIVLEPRFGVKVVKKITNGKISKWQIKISKKINANLETIKLMWRKCSE